MPERSISHSRQSYRLKGVLFGLYHSPFRFASAGGVDEGDAAAVGAAERRRDTMAMKDLLGIRDVVTPPFPTTPNTNMQ